MTGSVVIKKHGRSGAICYAEGPRRTHEFYAELGGGDSLLLISAPAPEEWPRVLPWAAGRRESILERIALEVVRLESPNSKFIVHASGVDILVPQA
jgi:hypothetical protein